MNMIEVKTAELSGAALDWAVAQIEAERNEEWCVVSRAISRTVFVIVEPDTGFNFSPSSDWSQGGPLIEEYRVAIDYRALSKTWDAYCSGWMNGCETPLIAACRAIVAAKLGDTVQVPAELLP
ncbi:hypothetical protein [Leptolyngbya phage Lbo-JY16]